MSDDSATSGGKMIEPNAPRPPGSPARGAFGPSGPGWRPPTGPYLTGTIRRFSLDRLLPDRVVSALTALVSRPCGAILLAGLFGLIALPTVILGVPGYDMSIARNAWDPR